MLQRVERRERHYRVQRVEIDITEQRGERDRHYRV
jgi:hypothetical protein